MELLTQVKKFAWNRWTANIAFWAILVGVKATDLPEDPTFWHYFFFILLFGIQIAVIYANNLVLAPALLSRRRYGAYISYVTLLCLLASFIYWLILKAIILFFPEVEFHSVSSIMPLMGRGTDGDALLQEMPTIFIVLLLLSFVFTMAWYMRDNLRQQKAVEAAQKKQIEAELMFLKSQINPHFLFNTLNNLYGLALKKSDKAPDAILKLSSILRYLLYESNTERIDFQKEKEIMLAYIELEMLRLNNPERFRFNIKSDKERKIPPLLWMPVLENIFKHGTRYMQEGTTAEFSFTIENEQLTIYSKNAAKAAVLGNESLNGGLGLENLRKRLAILYPEKHSLSAGKQNEQYIAQVQISL